MKPKRNSDKKKVAKEKKPVNLRSVLAKVIVIVVLLGIAALMLVIGRGHTVFFDNAPLEYEGKTYDAPYMISVYKGDELVNDIASKPKPQRTSVTVIGQRCKVTIKVKDTRNSIEKTFEVSVKLPYGMDGIAINLPAYLAGLPEEAYLSEVIILAPDEPDPSSGVPGEETIPGSDADIGGIG